MQGIILNSASCSFQNAEDMIIFFDLEGPLSPQDNAYEVMKLIGEEGAALFETISRYDDILTLEGREGYEPGDTLALIIPFLLLHGITESDIRRVSEQATLVEGTKYLFERLRARGWDIYIISTSYEQHAHNIGHKLGVEHANIVCTELNFDHLVPDATMKKEIIEATRRIEEAMRKSHTEDELISIMDDFFFRELPAIGFNPLEKIQVVGGAKKAEAIQSILHDRGLTFSDAIAVGDSITDYKMLKLVKEEGGLAVVFNGNEYSVPYASVGLASMDISFLLILCDAFACGGNARVKDVVEVWSANRRDFENNPREIPDDCISAELRDYINSRMITLPYFHNIDDGKLDEIIEIHRRMRMKVRAHAGKLG